MVKKEVNVGLHFAALCDPFAHFAVNENWLNRKEYLERKEKTQGSE